MKLEFKITKIRYHNVLSVKYFDGNWLSLRQLSKTKECVKNKLTQQAIQNRIRKRGNKIEHLEELISSRSEYTDRIYNNIPENFL